MKKTDQKTLKHEYREIVETVQHVLNEWDPYDLLKGGAPENEFTEEATQITAKIKNSETPTALAHVISDIFSRNFESDQFPVEACLPTASRIFKELEARRLLK
jgi:Domain of unknown function (DUF1871)